MLLGEQLMEQRLFDDAVRLVLDALPALVADDVLLVREVGLIDLIEQVAHPIRLEPQRQLELVRGNGLEVVRAIEVGGAVDRAAAGALDQPEMRIAGHVLRALEHHVLEEVREPGASRLFVGRTDVIPEIHGDERQPVILRQDDLEPVRQRELLEFERRRRRRFRRLRRFGSARAARQSRGCRNDHREKERLHDAVSITQPPWVLSAGLRPGCRVQGAGC